MLSFKEKLMDDISKLNEEQVRKLYHFFQVVKKEILLVPKDDWKEDFKNISVWENDVFDQIEEGFKNWKITEF